MRRIVARAAVLVSSAALAVPVVAVGPARARTCEVNIMTGGSWLDVLGLVQLPRAHIGAAGFCYDHTVQAARTATPYVCRVYAQVVGFVNAIPPVLAAAGARDPLQDYCSAADSAFQTNRCEQWYVEAEVTSYGSVSDFESDYPVVCAPA